MAEDLKGLKVKDSVSGKILTTDANGVMKSSDVAVEDVAMQSDVTSLADRVTAIEGNITNTVTQLQDING